MSGTRTVTLPHNFQYQQVRLRHERDVRRVVLEELSIPAGAIEATSTPSELRSVTSFQYQQVRLRRFYWAEYTFYAPSFNTSRCD